MHLKHRPHIQSSAIQTTHTRTQSHDLHPALRPSLHRSRQGQHSAFTGRPTERAGRAVLVQQQHALGLP